MVLVIRGTGQSISEALKQLKALDAALFRNMRVLLYECFMDDRCREKLDDMDRTILNLMLRGEQVYR